MLLSQVYVIIYIKNFEQHECMSSTESNIGSLYV